MSVKPDLRALQERTEAKKAAREPREWLLSGGGGHEDGADGLRALNVSGECLVDFLEAYKEYLDSYAAEQVAEARLSEHHRTCGTISSSGKCLRCIALGDPIAIEAAQRELAALAAARKET